MNIKEKVVFVGLDASKATLAVSVADDSRNGEIRDWGTISTTDHYNTQRTHQGKMCCGRTPFETMIPSQRCKHRLPGNGGYRNLEGKVCELNLTRQMPPEKR